MTSRNVVKNLQENLNTNQGIINTKQWTTNTNQERTTSTQENVINNQEINGTRMYVDHVDLQIKK